VKVAVENAIPPRGRSTPQITIQVSTLAQYRAACELPNIARIYVPPELLPQISAPVFCILPPIDHSDEPLPVSEHIVGYLASTHGQLKQLQGTKKTVVADYSFNIYNPHARAALPPQYVATLSPEAPRFTAENSEIIVYGRIPTMYSKFLMRSHILTREPVDHRENPPPADFHRYIFTRENPAEIAEIVTQP
jgi:hypothetical protein